MKKVSSYIFKEEKERWQKVEDFGEPIKEMSKEEGEQALVKKLKEYKNISMTAYLDIIEIKYQGKPILYVRYTPNRNELENKKDILGCLLYVILIELQKEKIEWKVETFISQKESQVCFINSKKENILSIAMENLVPLKTAIIAMLQSLKLNYFTWKEEGILEIDGIIFDFKSIFPLPKITERKLQKIIESKAESDFPNLIKEEAIKLQLLKKEKK